MLMGLKVSRAIGRKKCVFKSSAQFAIFGIFPLGGNLSCRARHRSRGLNIGGCKGIHHRRVPHQMTTRTPRNHCQSVWSSSVCACKTWRFFDQWDACLGKRAVYDVVDGAVSRDSAETERARQSVAASGIYSGSTSTHVWLIYCDSKAQADRHSNVLVLQS